MIVLAFSGGLDTSFCVPYLRETTGEDVVTVTVNTGGFSEEQLREVEQRSRELGAVRHVTVDARADLWKETLQYLVKGNVLRGGVYPLCVGPERVTQARKVVEVAREVGANTIAHGSTGAGNDQVRFDVAVRILGGGLKVLAPIRELALSRNATADYLEARGFAVNREKAAYSINRG
ncbi:MAG TPA: argininosuccinate synthase domain-containing protein, partial [Rhodothermales bacterium]|nr:argininosuccinate synthase domain-containing protein [Rhodothermales bacterium]